MMQDIHVHVGFARYVGDYLLTFVDEGPTSLRPLRICRCFWVVVSMYTFGPCMIVWILIFVEIRLFVRAFSFQDTGTSNELIGAYSSNDLTNTTKYAEFELIFFQKVLQLLLIYNLNMCFLAVVLASKCIAPYSGSRSLDTTRCPPQNVHPKLSLFQQEIRPPTTRSQGWGRVSEKHEVDCLRVRSSSVKTWTVPSVQSSDLWSIYWVHPRKLRWNPKVMEVWKMMFLSNWVIF